MIFILAPENAHRTAHSSIDPIDPIDPLAKSLYSRPIYINVKNQFIPAVNGDRSKTAKS